MAENLVGAVQQRYADAALHAHVDQRVVFRTTLLHAARVVAQLSARDVLARGSGEIVLDVGKERAVTPECQRTDTRLAVGELGDDRVRGVERQAQIPHQVVKELRARGSDGPFDQAA